MMNDIKLGKLYRDKRYSNYTEIVIPIEVYETKWQGQTQKSILYSTVLDPDNKYGIDYLEAKIVWEELKELSE